MNAKPICFSLSYDQLIWHGYFLLTSNTPNINKFIIVYVELCTVYSWYTNAAFNRIHVCARERPHNSQISELTFVAIYRQFCFLLPIVASRSYKSILVTLLQRNTCYFPPITCFIIVCAPHVNSVVIITTIYYHIGSQSSFIPLLRCILNSQNGVRQKMSDRQANS